MAEMSEGLHAWVQAVRLMTEFDRGKLHLDDLLDQYDPGSLRMRIVEVFRNRLYIDKLIRGRIRRQPRPHLLNLLRLAMGELMDPGTGEPAPVVHHAGEVAKCLKLSRGECGFVNGVLRQSLRDGLPRPSLEESHPDWLVDRWRRAYGLDHCRSLLHWNQQPAPLYLCTKRPTEGLAATPWPGYFRVEEGFTTSIQARLESGEAYVQDPFARIPVELLKVSPGETVLDLCAAPGGKTRLLAECLDGQGVLFAVDVPGRRLERLEQNLSRCADFMGRVIGSRIEDLGNEPEGVDAVLLDVPCSNTGVIRRRPDVKLRLSEEEIHRQARQQTQMLAAAASRVRPGGRLCYSTCSLEREENEFVVSAFLESHADWVRADSVLSTPWECGHDGGGAFLLTRKRS